MPQMLGCGHPSHMACRGADRHSQPSRVLVAGTSLLQDDLGTRAAAAAVACLAGGMVNIGRSVGGSLDSRSRLKDLVVVEPLLRYCRCGCYLRSIAVDERVLETNPSSALRPGAERRTRTQVELLAGCRATVQQMCDLQGNLQIGAR